MKRITAAIAVVVLLWVSQTDGTAGSTIDIPGFAYVRGTTNFVNEGAKALSPQSKQALLAAKRALAAQLKTEIQGQFAVAEASWGFQVNFTALKGKKDGVWSELPEGFGEVFLSKDLKRIEINCGP